MPGSKVVTGGREDQTVSLPSQSQEMTGVSLGPASESTILALGERMGSQLGWKGDSLRVI